MRLSAAGNGGAVVDVGGETWHVPSFPMAAAIDWAAEIDARREADFRKSAEAIADGERRFHHLTAYSWRPAGVYDVQDAGALTPAGVLRVVRHCLPLARVTARGNQPVTPEPVNADLVEAAIAASDLDALRVLARKLLGLPDPPPPPAAKDAKETKEQKGEDESPLTPGSPPTPKTPSGD